MSRLTRAEAQGQTRAKVLAAARAEFAERGYRDAKIDNIADRADLTRGAIYSNFAGKRALYLSVLADLAEHPRTAAVEPGVSRAEALAAFADVWLGRLVDSGDDTDPTQGGYRLGAELATPTQGGYRLGAELATEVLADDDTRWQYAQLMKLNAILLGLTLERLQPENRERQADPAHSRWSGVSSGGVSSGGVSSGGVGSAGSSPVRPTRVEGGRLVGLAEVVLSTLQGAGQLTAAAPGFVQPITVAKACAQLASLELDDHWQRPPTLPAIRPDNEAWAPPPVVDALRNTPARLGPDGLFVVLGLNRLAAAEDAVRAVSPGTAVTVALVSSRPAELGPLARLTVAELSGCLRQAFPSSALPELQLVHDESGEFATAAGAQVVGNDLEYAIRVSGGRIAARSEGFGAAHAAALAEVRTPATIGRLV
ncbi:TetR/AcrR family transcriptional regulator [Kribbella alba]|uniref:TetR/AcrR family transcriptional regulator n=1 Tax=Kribbella alba TaxID=190197 RepID=A0ABP4R6E6_9ACTN